MSLITLYLYIPIGFAVLSGFRRIGESFIDNFRPGRQVKLWNLETGWKPLPKFNYYFLRTDNLVYLMEDNRCFLEISCRNDCLDCCLHDLCTPYSSGCITSMETYGKGSFRWHALAAHDTSGKQTVGIFQKVVRFRIDQEF